MRWTLMSRIACRPIRKAKIAGAHRNEANSNIVLTSRTIAPTRIAKTTNRYKTPSRVTDVFMGNGNGNSACIVPQGVQKFLPVHMVVCFFCFVRSPTHALILAPFRYGCHGMFLNTRKNQGSMLFCLVARYPNLPKLNTSSETERKNSSAPMTACSRHLVPRLNFRYNSSMFEWRFRITHGIIPLPLLEKAFFAGWGRIPRLTDAIVLENELLIHTDSCSSGTIHVPMAHSPLGVVLESTESLLSQHEPYLLVRELARGALGRCYRRTFDWQMTGFIQPQELDERLKSIAKRFSSAVVQGPSAPEIEREFVSILDDIALFIVDANKEYAEQSLSWRTRNDERLPITLGIGTNARHFDSPYDFDAYAKLLHDSFHVVLHTPTWRELEPQPGCFDWERLEQHLMIPVRFGFQIVFGPLISFSEDTFPEWLLPRLSEEGFFESRATRFVNTIAERYGYLAHSWILANRFVAQTLPDLPPERSLGLIRILAQQLRSRGIETPVIVCINQPWGEYALQQTPNWEQVQIAETLIGCRDIDTFMLEIDIGSGENLTLPRDPMCIGNMLDQWSFLGKQIYVSLSVPSAGGPVATTSELAPEMQWSEDKQRIWTETLLLTCLSKRMVRGIFWSCLQDPIAPGKPAAGCDYGLLNAQQELKSACKHFAAIRKNLLQ